MIKNNKQHHVYNIFEYILFFFGYAGIGYLYETILEVIIYRWGFYLDLGCRSMGSGGLYSYYYGIG